MLKTLLLRDFQSWDDVTIELAPITVIVGKGNSGKSAIVRAIQYALTNQGGDEFIRQGADSCTVGMVIDDNVLTWEKARGKGGEYNLNGTKYTKTGQTVPQEIEDATGFRRIEIDKNLSIMPNIHGQFDQPFLVFESGSRTARILGKLTRVDTLVSAQLAARRDLKNCEQELASSEADVKSLTEQLESLPDVATIRGLYDQATQAVQAEQDAAALLRRAEATVQAYRRDSRQAADYDGLANQCAAAQAALARYDAADAARVRYHRTVAEWADAIYAGDVANASLEELKAEYEAACQEAGVCEVCPWR